MPAPLPPPPLQLFDYDTQDQIGNEIRVDNTESGADGTATSPFVFFVPFTAPRRLSLVVVADAGATRSPKSNPYGPVVVGAWRGRETAAGWGWG